MGETTTGTQEATATTATRVNKVVELPSGKKAVIYKGKGRDANRALKEADGDQSKYMVCLMSILVEVDGKPIVAEDLEDMDMQDYMALQTAFAEENF